MSMDNVTCYNFTQSLDHFNRATSDTFYQRYCIYDGYENLTHDPQSPIFFYTGNESPLDEYVNNTGLLWELAAKPIFSALVVFAEHRFQGESHPRYSDLSGGCFEHLTTTQALQDFASLISFLNPGLNRPVITFGGSYGGMLSSWMRMKFPGMIAGAISSSAPVWGFPKTMMGNITTTNESAFPNDGTMDGAFHVVAEALKIKLNEVNEISKETRCFDNLLAAWPLIHFYGQTESGRKALSREFNLCNPIESTEDVNMLLEWAQSPWFDLAEADYPYKSSYVPYALGEGNFELPAWPLQEACHGKSGLSQDFKISIEGRREDVSFSITYPSGLELKVDWDKLIIVKSSQNDFEERNFNLLRTVRDAVAVWFNVTQSLDCFDVIPAVNSKYLSMNLYESTWMYSTTISRQLNIRQQLVNQICMDKIEKETVWSSLVCNENLNLIMTYAKGVGRDCFWPPSHPKDQITYRDTLLNRSVVEENYEILCGDPDRIFGYPKKEMIDPYSSYFDDMYGSKRIGSHSNIIFSNGLLDPWSAAGVYSFAQNTSNRENDTDLCSMSGINGEIIDYACSMVQEITKDGDILSIILDLGGHHLDLMFSFVDDPVCATTARKIEEVYIYKWINEWKIGSQYQGKECV